MALYLGTGRQRSIWGLVHFTAKHWYCFFHLLLRGLVWGGRVVGQGLITGLLAQINGPTALLAQGALWAVVGIKPHGGFAGYSAGDKCQRIY